LPLLGILLHIVRSRSTYPDEKPPIPLHASVRQIEARGRSFCFKKNMQNIRKIQQEFLENLQKYKIGKIQNGVRQRRTTNYWAMKTKIHQKSSWRD